MDATHRDRVETLLADAAAEHERLMSQVPPEIAESLPVDAQGVTGQSSPNGAGLDWPGYDVGRDNYLEWGDKVKVGSNVADVPETIQERVLCMDAKTGQKNFSHFPGSAREFISDAPDRSVPKCRCAIPNSAAR